MEKLKQFPKISNLFQFWLSGCSASVFSYQFSTEMVYYTLYLG